MVRRYLEKEKEGWIEEVEESGKFSAMEGPLEQVSATDPNVTANPMVVVHQNAPGVAIATATAVPMPIVTATATAMPAVAVPVAMPVATATAMPVQ